MVDALEFRDRTVGVGQIVCRQLTLIARRRRIDLIGNVAMNLVSVFCGRTSVAELTVRAHPYGTLSRPAEMSVVLRVGSDAQHQLLPRLSALADATVEQPIGVAVQLVVHTGIKQNQPLRAGGRRASCTPEIATDQQPTATTSAVNHEPALHDAVLRVAAAHAATLATAITVLTTLARSFGVEPERLDGRHTAGVVATLPLGVPLS